MKNIRIFLMATFICFQLVGKAHAVIPVTDVAHIATTQTKAIMDLLWQYWDKIRREYAWATQNYNETQMIYHQVTQIMNQYNQIEQMTTALSGIDPSSYSKLKSSLQNTYWQTDDLFGRLRGMNDNVEAIEGKFARAYPTLEAMAKLDPVGWKAVVNTTSKEQVDNIYNAKLKAANIAKMNKEMQTKLENLSDQNNNVQGLKEAAQLGNQIALQQQQLALQQNENLALMLKQNADNINNLMMLQQAMQLEASKTFKYTPTPVTVEGPGIYQIK